MYRIRFDSNSWQFLFCACCAVWNSLKWITTLNRFDSERIDANAKVNDWNKWRKRKTNTLTFTFCGGGRKGKEWKKSRRHKICPLFGNIWHLTFYKYSYTYINPMPKCTTNISEPHSHAPNKNNSAEWNGKLVVNFRILVNTACLCIKEAEFSCFKHTLAHIPNKILFCCFVIFFFFRKRNKRSKEQNGILHEWE